jgi:hypothetical protein
MRKRPTERFLNAEGKLEWAKQHINQLDRYTSEFLRDRLKLLGYYGTFNQLEMRVEYEKSLPFNFGLMIGDIANALRGALDHIMWELIEPNLALGDEKSRRRVAYPFADDAARFETRIKDGLIQLAGPEAIRVISKSRPYAGGDDLLYGLSILNNWDKHRIVLAVGDYVHIHGLKADEAKRRPYIAFHDLKMGHGPKYVRDIEYHWGSAVATDGTVDKDQFDMTFHIVFGEGQPFAGLSVLPTMVALVGTVQGILDDFDDAFPSRYSPEYFR